MTSTIRKRAERLRRKEAGYKRVEFWLRDDVIEGMDKYCAHNAEDRESFLSSAVWYWLKENPK